MQNAFGLANKMKVFLKSLLIILHKNSKCITHRKCSKRKVLVPPVETIISMEELLYKCSK